MRWQHHVMHMIIYICIWYIWSYTYVYDTYDHIHMQHHMIHMIIYISCIGYRLHEMRCCIMWPMYDHIICPICVYITYTYYTYLLHIPIHISYTYYIYDAASCDPCMIIHIYIWSYECVYHMCMIIHIYIWSYTHTYDHTHMHMITYTDDTWPHTYNPCMMIHIRYSIITGYMCHHTHAT